MNPQTFSATTSAYTISKIGLLAGTGFEAYTQWGALFSHWLPTAFFTGLTCLLFDRTAFKFLEQYASHLAGQTRLSNAAAWLSFTVGVLAFAGTMGFSLMAVPIIADATTKDRSDTYKDLASTKADADNAKAGLLAEANAEIQRSEIALAKAKSAAASATTNAIRREGGSFAQLMQDGNTWVRSAPQFSRQRANVRNAQADADNAVKAAEAQLTAAMQAKQTILLQKDDNAAAVMAAGIATVETWQQRRTNMRAVTLYLTIGAGIISLLSLSVLAAFKRIPDGKDITDVIGEGYDNMLQFVVIIGDATNRAFVAHVLARMGQQRETVSEVVSPQPESSVRNLQKKIREYRKRAEAGTLGKKGYTTLQRMEWQINTKAL